MTAGSLEYHSSLNRITVLRRGVSCKKCLLFLLSEVAKKTSLLKQPLQYSSPSYRNENCLQHLEMLVGAC